MPKDPGKEKMRNFLAWIPRGEWEHFNKLRPELQGKTYEAFVEDAERISRSFEAKGETIRKVFLRTAEFEAFCKRRGLATDERDSFDSFFSQRCWEVSHASGRRGN